LREERKKLLHAHYADALPLELLKEEQDRITCELNQAESVLASARANFARIEAMYNKALDLATDCQRAYELADPKLRRMFNQVFWKSMKVDQKRVVGGDLSDPFAALLAEDLVRGYTREAKNPGHVLCGQGSSKSDLVGGPPRTLLQPRDTPDGSDQGRQS
jgi:hypothetical protein